MKPKLKADVYWIPRGESLAFIHSGDMFTVTGRTALPLMDRLAPYLDGSVTLDELTDSLPEGKKDMVVALVTALVGAGLVKDVQDDEPHELTPAELDRYAAEIAYVDHHLASAARRFQDHRSASVVCVGAGLSFVALVCSCLRSGVADVAVLLADDCPTDVDRLTEQITLLCAGDPRQRVSRRALEDAALEEAVLAADVVLHVSDRPVLRRARELDRLCRRHGRLLVQGIVIGDEAWTGPVVDKDGPGWESGWLRRFANDARAAGPLDGAFGAEPAAPSPFLAGPTASVVGNRVGFLAFRHLTGVDAASKAPETAAMGVVDLETLATSRHPLVAHPAAAPADPETEGEFADRWAAFLSASDREPADFSRRAAELFDDRLGVFATLDEDELTQVPLHVARAEVSDPFGWLDTTGGRPAVVGVGDDLAEARREAALRACALYATLALDQRRLADGTVLARDLGSDRTEPIDANWAYPVRAAAGPAAALFTAPVGLAAAASSAEALRLGLLDQCERLAARAAAGKRELPRLSLADVELDEAGARWLEAVRLTGQALAVYDVTGALGVPVLAFCLPDRTVCYAAGSDVREAARNGLERTLRDYQAADAGQPSIALPPVPDLPSAARGGSGRATGAVAADWRAIAAALTAAGHRVHALPVGHDPALTAVLPGVVQVVVR
jgi:putative thiazole-containing bacteriocin maturation protein